MNAKDVAHTPLFKKLNLGAHDEIALFDAPDSFGAELKQLKGVTIVRNPGKPAEAAASSSRAASGCGSSPRVMR